MRLDIYREFLLKINNDLNIDGEYALNSEDLKDKFDIDNPKRLKEVYSSLYSRNKFYHFKESTTLEEAFLIRIDLRNNNLYFSLNPIWKRSLFFKGKSISQSLMEIWGILTEEAGDENYSKIIDLSSGKDESFSDFKKELKRGASLKSGHDQMVIIGLIERSKDIEELKNLAARYNLFEKKQDDSNDKLDTRNLSLQEYKSQLRNKVNTYPSYKRMSLLGFINRADSKEVLDNIFNGETISDEVMKKIGESFHEKKKEVKRVEVILDEETDELETYKGEVRKKVMKMSTFNKMTILGFISRASNKEEILSIIEKYQIK